MKFNLFTVEGVAVREYLTDKGPVDYVLFVNKTPGGVIEAKREEEGVKITVLEDQSREYTRGQA